jgi:autotransporter strand-loop-strand O-heptosyltransferase
MSAQGSPYPPVAQRPTQEGPAGIRFDFNHGARVSVPPVEHGKWRVRLRDIGTGNVLFDTENAGAMVSSSKRYHVVFGIDVWRILPDGAAEQVLVHEYDASGRDVLIVFPVGTLGDTLGWLPYAVRFADLHSCRLTCAMSGLIIPLVRDAYPEVVGLVATAFRLR